MGISQPTQAKLMMTVRILGICAGCCAIAIGLYQLITSAFNPRRIINSIYQIIFGLLILIAEFRWTRFLKHFRFLTHFLGLGLFYCFVGGLALNSEWYQYAEAILCLTVGIIYLMLGAACRTMEHPTFDGVGAPASSSSSTAAGSAPPKQETDTITDLKKKAAHAAVDHAIDSGTNPFA